MLIQHFCIYFSDNGVVKSQKLSSFICPEKETEIMEIPSCLTLTVKTAFNQWNSGIQGNVSILVPVTKCKKVYSRLGHRKLYI